MINDTRSLQVRIMLLFPSINIASKNLIFKGRWQREFYRLILFMNGAPPKPPIQYLNTFKFEVHMEELYTFKCAYTVTLLAMVNVRNGGGRAPPIPSPAQANFTLMTECTPESRRYYSVYSVPVAVGRYTYPV
jgi:hypothetical protein